MQKLQSVHLRQNLQTYLYLIGTNVQQRLASLSIGNKQFGYSTTILAKFCEIEVSRKQWKIAEPSA